MEAFLVLTLFLRAMLMLPKRSVLISGAIWLMTKIVLALENN
ncbi:hypothetical protein [Bacillus sp. UNCCL13]|nr:hypothetical protein [Bacillus sp. UNCCL13]